MTILFLGSLPPLEITGVRRVRTQRKDVFELGYFVSFHNTDHHNHSYLIEICIGYYSQGYETSPVPIIPYVVKSCILFKISIIASSMVW